MRPAQRPTQSGGLIEIGPPMDGPNAPLPPEPEIAAEESMEEVPDGIGKLIGQFFQEIEWADYARQAKERVWIKIRKYMGGKDTMEKPKDYTESTFFYRRLPRITQTAKAKLYKHVCPIQGRPWETSPSPRHNQGMSQQDQDKRISRLREEITDIHAAMELENLMDDTCQFMSDLGSAVLFGPIKLNQPRLRWQNGAEVLDEDDSHKPMWKFYDPCCVYPDANAKRWEELEYVHFYHILSPHQIRTLVDDPTFIGGELADLLEELPDGNWSGQLRRWEEMQWPANYTGSPMRRYATWMRIGFLTAEAIEALGEKVPDTDAYKDLKKFRDLNKDQRRIMTESLWEIWFCDKHVLKVSRWKFQPKRMPVYFIPFRQDPASIFGIGAGEAAIEVCEMLVNITRSIDDALDDTSGFQMIVDAARVENKDLKVRGRKTWLWRNKTGSRERTGSQEKPIEFFTVPSNLPHLLECYKLFELMLPIVSGVPEMVIGKDMGSGIRTDNMLNDMWESLEEFLRDVVGNVDRYWWKPHLRDTIHWIQMFYPNWEEFHVEADLQVQGVRGALRREIVGRKAKELFVTLNQFGMPDWLDEIELEKAIAEGMGMEQEKMILTVEDYLKKQEIKAKQKELDAAAGRAPEDRAKEQERAHTSTRDMMLTVFKSIMSKDEFNPVLIPTVEKIFKLSGEVDPKAVAALSVWAKMLVAELTARGVANQQEQAVLEQPMKADNPLELSPGARNQQEAAKASIAGPGPATPPNPAPAMPTTQQMLGGRA